jgi:hypothetical protein
MQAHLHPRLISLSPRLSADEVLLDLRVRVRRRATTLERSESGGVSCKSKNANAGGEHQPEHFVFIKDSSVHMLSGLPSNKHVTARRQRVDYSFQYNA